MKSSTLRIAFTLLISFTLVSGSFASQHTVSKDPNRVAQYNDLQLAIDDAANGDTLLVYGATTSYGSVNVYKPLVLIGEGYNENLGLTTMLSSISFTRFNTTLSSSGSTMMGFDISGSISLGANFTGSTYENRNLNNLTFLRNRCRSVEIGWNSISEEFTNINFINMIVEDIIYLNQYASSQYEDSEEVTFSNCIFDGVYFYGALSRSNGVLGDHANFSNVKVYNSMFLNYETGLLYNTVGLVFEDNIFFGQELYYADYDQITWNNNLFYLVDQTVNLMTNNNVGSGNLIDTDPQFVNYPPTPAAFSYDHDYSLQAGSPALTASVNGGEIGIYGGAYPFAVGAKPPVPQVTEVTIQDGTSSVPVGGTINFNFKAESGN